VLAIAKPVIGTPKERRNTNARYIHRLYFCKVIPPQGNPRFVGYKSFFVKLS
jgi:hypothetical protein